MRLSRLVLAVTFASLSAERVELLFNREVFILLKSGGIMVSPDALRWAETQDALQAIT